jgi:hypothetical protein
MATSDGLPHDHGEEAKKNIEQQPVVCYVLRKLQGVVVITYESQ